MGVQLEKIKLRLAKTKDRSSINELATKILEMHKNELPHVFMKNKIEYSEKQFKKMVSDSDHYITVAEVNNKIIGFSYMEVLTINGDDRLPSDKVACLSMIYVKPEYRRYDVGTKLMLSMEDEAKRRKSIGEVSRIEFRIWSFNKTSQGFCSTRNIKPLYTIYELLYESDQEVC